MADQFDDLIDKADRGQLATSNRSDLDALINRFDDSVKEEPGIGDYAAAAGNRVMGSLAEVPSIITRPAAALGIPGAEEASRRLDESSQYWRDKVSPQLMQEGSIINDKGLNITPYSVASSVAEGIPSALPYLAATPAGPVGWAAVGALQGGGDAYWDTRDKAKRAGMSDEDADKVGRLVGLGGSVVGVGSALLGGKMAESLASKASSKVGQSVLGAVGFTPAAVGQSVIDTISQNKALGKDNDYTEIGKQAVAAAIGNLATGSVLGLHGKPAETQEDRYKRLIGTADKGPSEPPLQPTESTAPTDTSDIDMASSLAEVPQKIAAENKEREANAFNRQAIESIAYEQGLEDKNEALRPNPTQEELDKASQGMSLDALQQKARDTRELNRPYPKTPAAKETTAENIELGPEQLQNLEFRHTGDAKEDHFPVGEVQSAGQKYLALDKHQLKLTAYSDFSNDPNIPQSVRDEAAKRGISDPSAFRIGDRIFLNANHIDSYTELVRQIEHEKTHIGQELINFKPDLYKQYQDIADKFPDRAQAIANDSKTGTEPYDLTNPDHKAAIGSEILAQVGETNPYHSFVRQAIVKIKDGLRKLGLNVKYSNKDLIEKYIMPAKDWLREGKTNGYDFTKQNDREVKFNAGASFDESHITGKTDEYGKAINEEMFRRNRLANMATPDFAHVDFNPSNKGLYKQLRDVYSELKNPHLSDEEITDLDKKRMQFENQIHDNNLDHIRRMIKEGKPLSKYKPDFQHNLQDPAKMDDDRLKRVYVDQVRRNQPDGIENTHRELTNRGIDPNEPPKEITPDMTIEEANHQSWLHDVADARAEASEPKPDKLPYDKMSEPELTKERNNLLDEIQRMRQSDDPRLDEKIQDYADINKEFRTRQTQLKPSGNLQSVEGQKVSESNRLAANELPRTEFQHGTRKQKVEEKAKEIYASSKLHEIMGFLTDNLYPQGKGSILNPDTVGKNSKIAGSSLVSLMGHSARELRKAEQGFDAVRKVFQKWTDQDRIQFEENMMLGKAQATPELQKISNGLAKLLFKSQADISKMAPEAKRSFISEFLPGMYKRPNKAREYFERRIREENSKGNGNYIPSTKEAYEAGLKPISTNPVDMTLYRVQEMNRFVVGRSFVNDMFSRGMAKAFTNNDLEPLGWVKLDTRFAATIHPREFNEEQKGQWYVPKEVEQIVHNYLTPGWRSKIPGFSDYMHFAGQLNNAQLGMSGFHAVFTTFDVMNGSIALGVQEASEGNFGQAAKNIAQMIPMALSSYSKHGLGEKLREAYTDPTKHPELQQTIQDFVRAGGRDKETRWYDDKMWNKFTEAWARNDIGGVAKSIVPGVLNKISSPIMETLVPRQKLLMFSLMAERSRRLAAKNNETEDQLTTRLQNDLNSVDNRLGQLVYDNLHWNKTAKDILQMTTRSVSWNLGTARELGGGAVNLGKNAVDLFTKGKTELTPAGAYVISTALLTGLVGSIIQKVMTGKSPESWKDFVYPRIGGKDINGYDMRLSVPLYSKDIASYMHDPVDTITNKMNPAISMLHEIWQNKDFYNQEITHPGDNIASQMLDESTYIGKQFIPFGIRNAFMSPQYDALGKAKYAQMVGFPKAPQWVEGTPAYDLSSKILRASLSDSARTKEEFQRYQLANQIKSGLINDDPKVQAQARDLMDKEYQKGHLLDTDIKRIEEKTDINDPLVYNITKIHRPEDAIRVLKEANPQEREKIKDVILDKIDKSRTISDDRKDQLEKQVDTIMKGKG